MDCDSISFGRYASDTLAWEKYSAFSHNRCQEELEKFKAPGLVAQKKAYFEEYYKKIRAMKGLKAEQETTQTDPNQNGQEIPAQEHNSVGSEASKEEIKPSNTCQEESVADVHGSKEENKHSNDYKIQVLDSHTTDIVNPSTGGINDGEEEDSYFDGNSGRARKDDEKRLCLSARITKHSMEGGSSSCVPSVKSSSKTTQNESGVSNEVKHGGSQLKKQGSSARAKGNVSSAANRTKLDCRISKDVVKRSQKPNPSVCREIKRKEDVILASGKRITSKTSSNIKSDRVQSQEVYVKQVQLPKSLADRVPAAPSGLTRSAQRGSKEITNISRLRKISVDKRSCDGFGQRSLVLSGHHSLPKSRESGNQGPKVMLKNLSDRILSKGQRQKKGIDEIVAGLEPKSVSSKGTSIQRASTLKPVNKIATSKSVDLMCNPRASRHIDVAIHGLLSPENCVYSVTWTYTNAIMQTEDANLALSV
ncbi:TPX2 (TARGETING PROTEIN FOR XKLP2) PROTEIN FAMILY-RELATED [Salix koriyanagi]|uniref:TPX2 (TARGETING PROTEIN FOR XKLP2) PROTEIN FAMILY-RELATED n=1 Tax=Salix koriyanagi TaxID=2511006 RepID=A0A9Q0W7V0_9ROSI|nr:TPX2 (TARGETING PROTEIN FOR XKLP2) PROTEIN FAMILY-RELATED [Salix koriyanagi]